MDVFPTKIPETLTSILARVPSLSVFDAAVALTALWAFARLVRMSRRRLRATRLNGPPSPSFVFGVGKTLMESSDPASLYEQWASEYGAAYEIPATLGRGRIVLYDPKAIAHFHAKQGVTYVRTPVAKKAIRQSFGRGLFWASGESHRSIAAIRKLTEVFYDSAHKVEGAWNALIESSGGDSAIIDIQNWMNHVSLDTIGLAGFSHDFGALDGKHAEVTELFDSFTANTPGTAMNVGLNLLAQEFPLLVGLPTRRARLVWKLNRAMEEISNVLLARTKQELESGIGADKGEKSIIGLLIKGESGQSEFPLSKEEVLAQMKVLLFAGYETTSISLTWALIELSRNPEMQTKLRNELLEHGSDPTYDQLSTDLPYLDAVAHETLRTHAPVREGARLAAEDDVIPLSEPVRTKSGELVDNLSVVQGTVLIIPMASVNLSTAIWGEDAKVFRPGRWLEAEGRNGIPAKAKEVQGHRHLLTFSDGPQICLGKNFAVAEFKAVLSVLIRNFVFELQDGIETKIEMARGFLPRPRVAGEEGCKVPLRVKPYVG